MYCVPACVTCRDCVQVPVLRPCMCFMQRNFVPSVDLYEYCVSACVTCRDYVQVHVGTMYKYCVPARVTCRDYVQVLRPCMCYM